MPELRALAGRSPSWEAVFVQMEHCADAVAVKISNIINNGNINRHFFIVLKLVQKYVQNGKPTTGKENKNSEYRIEDRCYIEAKRAAMRREGLQVKKKSASLQRAD